MMGSPNSTERKLPLGRLRLRGLSSSYGGHQGSPPGPELLSLVLSEPRWAPYGLQNCSKLVTWPESGGCTGGRPTPGQSLALGLSPLLGPPVPPGAAPESPDKIRSPDKELMTLDPEAEGVGEVPAGPEQMGAPGCGAPDPALSHPTWGPSPRWGVFQILSPPLGPVPGGTSEGEGLRKPRTASAPALRSLGSAPQSSGPKAVQLEGAGQDLPTSQLNGGSVQRA